MLIENLGYDFQEWGFVFTDDPSHKCRIEVKRCLEQGEEKYKLHVLDGMSVVGSAHFFRNSLPFQDFVFGGFLVNSPFRGFGFSNLLLEILFRGAELSGHDFSVTTSQRKPLTTYILKKWGFVPIDQSKKNRVDILGREGSKLGIYFPDPAKRREFRTSRLMNNSGQYVVFDSLEGRKCLDSVVLVSPYVLVDEGKLRKKRQETQDRFSVSLYI